ILLGHILEKVSGKKYSNYVLDGVLKRGGLKTVAFDGKNPVPNRPKGYHFEAGKFIDAGEGGVAAVPSDGGGFCTTEDLTRWLEACNAGRVVKPETISLMQAPNVLTSGRKTAYGLGWMNRRINGYLQSSHGGNSVGFSATMSNFPDQKLTITMMCNLYPVGGDDFALGLARVLEPDLRPKPVSDGKDPNPERTEKLSKALSALVAAEIESPLFHDDMQARLKTGRGRMVLGAYATMKDFKLTFVDERDELPDHVIRYRATVGPASYLVEFFVDPSGLIYSIGRQADPGKS
ncbi:MAG: serine hydrolase domain-containing protein, partial [Fimbriimonadaceae bacterium]